MGKTLGPATKSAAASGLWAVYGISQPPRDHVSFERTDAAPVCWGDGVKATHNGQVLAQPWCAAMATTLTPLYRNCQELLGIVSKVPYDSQFRFRVCGRIRWK